MTAKTSGDSTPGVSGIIFRRIQDSFTTQGLRPKLRRSAAETLGVERLPPETLRRRRRRPDPREDPARNRADAEREEELEFQLGW